MRLSELDVNNLAIVSDQLLFRPIAIDVSNQMMTNNLTTLAMVLYKIVSYASNFYK